MHRSQWPKVLGIHEAHWGRYTQYYCEEKMLHGQQMAIDEIYLGTMITRSCGKQKKHQRVCWTQWDDFKFPFRGTFVTDDFVKKNFLGLAQGTYSTFGKGWLLARKCRDSEALARTLEVCWKKTDHDQNYIYSQK
mgnify:FL=1